MTGLNPSSAEPDASAARRLILIVDDEPAVRAMVHASIYVRRERYRVIEAGNAAEALALARAQQPLLVLLDVALPDHDGFWVCRSLKNTPSTAHIPVILCSAADAALRRHACEVNGKAPVEAVPKPFDVDHLLDVIARLLEPRAERQMDRLQLGHGAAERPCRERHGDAGEHGHDRHGDTDARVRELIVEDGPRRIDGIGERVGGRDRAQPGRREAER